MANVDGVRITVPYDADSDGNDEVFFGVGNLSLQIEHQSNWLLSGGNTVIGVADWLFENYAGSVVETPLASGHLGAASGSRTFEIAFDEWDGSSQEWGPLGSNSNEPVEEKMAVLDNVLAKARVDSLNPAQLEFGPYSAGASRYNPIPVVITQFTPTLDFGERGSSVFRPRITLQETVDLTQEIDGGSATPDYTLSATNASVDIPLSADTLGAGGRGTGRQEQGYETSPSGLAEKNADAASTATPTTQGTKVLPRSAQLRGAFRGSNAESLANDLRNEYLSNADVDTVTVTSNISANDPLEGDYILGERSAIDPLVPQQQGGLYGYFLDLQEK